MNIKTLENKLKNNNLTSRDYTIGARDVISRYDTYCIEQINNCWHVYYSERNYKRELKVFNSESEACEYFLVLIRKHIKSYI